MKRMRIFVIVCLCLAALYVTGSVLYFYTDLYIPLLTPEVSTLTRVSGKNIYLFEDGEYRAFEIRGVDMGAGLPGHFATDLALDKQTYLRWFDAIKAMGANCIRVYTILGTDFYEALYAYNSGNDDPLYVIHGLWLDDYMQFSHRDMYDADILDELIRDGHTLIDVLHGRRTINHGKDAGTGVYRKDVSQWIIGYILGVEWEDVTVEYTNHVQDDRGSYRGKYLYTTDEATPFEAALARLGDSFIQYETKRYGTQKMVAFSNWPTTDPFDYPEAVARHFFKFSKVDVEHIQTTEQFLAGTFASYHVYPYYPDYLSYAEYPENCLDPQGKVNTYYTYLKRLSDYHTIPTVISEYGVPAARGMAQRDRNTARHQGRMSEADQARAAVECYRDIMDAGCAGSVLFTWQDEWFKRTWNTMYAVDLLRTPFWSDYQTNEQYFGILSFDPGEDACICYVDGDIRDWSGDAPVYTNDGAELYVKYDEKFVYFMVKKDGLSRTDAVYIPIDTTQKSGGYYCARYDLYFDRGADFVIALNGADSRLVVQARYETLRAMKSDDTSGINAFENPPEKESAEFKNINLLLQTAVMLEKYDFADMDLKAFLSLDRPYAEVYETGALMEGNANPNAEDYNSLADYAWTDGAVEIKLPWQLLNFANPSNMKIHDDYYEHYGVEFQTIKEMYVGVTAAPGAGEPVAMARVPLKGWGNRVKYHERLKPAYFALKELWTGEGGGHD